VAFLFAWESFSDGNLYVVDVPHGRVFRIAQDGTFALVAEYDGEPNGLACRGACGWGCGDNIDPAIAAISVLLIVATVALVLVRLVWREAAERRMRQRHII